MAQKLWFAAFMALVAYTAAGYLYLAYRIAF
jgi:hypothetical protein